MTSTLCYTLCHPSVWTNAQCKAWINSWTPPINYKTRKQEKFGALKTKMTEMFKDGPDNEGEELRIMLKDGEKLKLEIEYEFIEKIDGEEFKQFETNAILCQVICKSYTALLRSAEDTFYKSVKNVNVYNNSNERKDSRNPDQSFNIKVMGIPGKQFLEIKNLKDSNTIKYLKEKIDELSGQTSKNFSLICGRECSDEGKTLEHYGIKPNSRVLFWIHANGGTFYQQQNRRHIQFGRHPNIKRSDVPDCLFHYRPRNGYSVAVMSCGHSMESESMFKYMQSAFQKNFTAVDMYCPLPKCKKAWDWQTCCVVAGMSPKENQEYSSKRELRKNVSLRECPHCGAYCKRNPSVVILRMSCSGCKGGDWCWECAQSWRGGGLIICNNANCQFVKIVNHVLAQSHLSVPSGWENISKDEKEKLLPDLRACPACLSFIRKPKGCKHMECPACKHKFCYSCLKQQKECAHESHTSFCNPEKIQNFK